MSDRIKAVLYEALASPVGLLLRSPDPHKHKMRLYAARAKAQDEALACLQFRIVDLDDGNLAICKQAPKAEVKPKGLSPEDLGL